MSEIISTTVQSKTKIKKIVVGTPIRRVTPTITTQNIADFDVTQQRDYDVLLYNAAADKYISSTLNFGNGLSASYNADSAIYNIEIDLETVTGNLIGGQSIDFDSATGTISVSQNIDSTGNPYFNNLTLSGYLRGPSVFTIDPAAYDSTGGTVVIAGNLQVDGTTTTINSTTLTVDDKNITLAQGATDNASANGAGITVDGINAAIGYLGSSNSWYLNRDVIIDSNLTVQNNASVGNDLTVTGGILIGDSARIGNDLRVLGDTTLFGVLSVDDSAEITGDLTVGGNATVSGGFTADSLNGVYQGFDSDFGVAIQSSGSIIPDQNLTRTLGDENNRWAEIYVGGNTLYLGDLVIKDVLSSFSVQDSAGQTVSIDFNGNTTSDLTEGTNLYYTRGRFDSALADNASIESIRGYFSAAGDLTYDSATGVFSFDVEDVYTKANFDSDFNAALDEATVGGIGLTYDSASNTINLANTPVVAGVYGSTTQIPVFVIDEQGRVDSAGVVSVASLSGVNYNTSTGRITVTASNGDSFNTLITLEPFSTSDLDEGDNLYYTTSRADSDTLAYLVANGYATQTYVDSEITQAINNVLDGAPAALDTLNELAEAINDDSNFAGTVTSILATKFNIADFDSAFDSRLDGKTTTDLDEGDNLYYTKARVDSDVEQGFNDRSTTDLDEGDNLYYTKVRVDSDVNQGFADRTTTDLAEGDNLYYTKVRVDSDFDNRLATKSTTNLAEGDNLYYTRARFDSDLTDSASTQSVRNMFSSGGDITYEPTTGEFSIDVEVVYTADNFDSDLDAAISGGTGLNYNPANNTVNIDSAELAAYFSTTDITEGNNLYYTKARTDSDVNEGFASRTTTDLDEGNNLYYTTGRADSDTLAYLINNSYATEAYVDSAVLNINNGSYVITTESDGITIGNVNAQAISITDNNGISIGGTGGVAITGALGATVDIGQNANSVTNIGSASGDIYFNGTIHGLSTNDIAESDNLYYTSARVDSDIEQGFNDRTTNDLDEGNNLYYTKVRVDSDIEQGFNDRTTTDLDEGNNLYYTKVRVDSDIEQGFNDRTTTDLDEGDNLYYTTARADSDAKNAVSGGTGVTYNPATGVIAIGQAVETTSDVTFGKVTADSAVLGGINLVRQSTAYDDAAGTLFFDSNPAKGLSFVTRTDEGAEDVTINIGQEQLVYTVNETGSNIENGTVVRFQGAAADGHPLIVKAISSSSTEGTIGVATQLIPNGGHGYVALGGVVRDVNTGGMNTGDDLYVSKDTAGVFTNISTSIDSAYPYHIGTVLTADSTAGSIFVAPYREHYEYLRIEDKLRVDGPIVADGPVESKYITFSGPAPEWAEGRVFYDSENGALGFYNDQSDITLQIGQEFYVRVYNNSGVTITNGTPVAFTGATGGIPTAAAADASDINLVQFVAGIATHNIDNGSYGYVTKQGSVGGVDTSTFSLGQPVYIASGGGLTTTVPTYPNYPVRVGGVTSIDSDGRVFVDIETQTQAGLRVSGQARIDGDLTVGGNFNLLGTETITSVTNLQVSDNFIYIGAGDTVITNFAGLGLNDATFKDYYTGDSSVEYNVEIISTDSAGDTIKWYLNGDSTALGFDSAGGQTSWNLGIDGRVNIPLRHHITIDFEAITGHDSNDRWYGDAAPANVDLGFVGNYNTSNAPYTHAGIFRDATDQKFKIFNKYNPEVEGDINTTDSSFELGTLTVNQLEIASGPNQINGKVVGDLTGLADRAKLLDSAQNIGIQGDITASNVLFNGGSGITLNATIDSSVISNVHISPTAAIVDTKLATISTSGKVQNSATTATDSNVPSTIVERNASGNFVANIVTADLVGDVTGQVSDISNHNTDSLSEGTSNLYYTRERFDNALGDSLSTQTIRDYFSAGGDLSYEPTTGQFSINVEEVYTQDNFDSDFNTALDAAAIDGVGIAYDAGSNTLSIDSAELAAYFSTGDITEGSNLYYTRSRFDSALGDSASTQSIRDYFSVVDNGGDGSLTFTPTTGEITYTGPSASEVRSHFSASGDLSYDSATGRFSIDVEDIYTADNFDSDLSATSTDFLPEGSTNLYYTASRVDSDFDSRLATKSTTDVSEGDNLYYTTIRADSDFDVRLATKSTTNLTEGDNLYYTVSRVDSDFDARLAIKSTTDLTEGDNLYYTTARADSDIASYLSDNSFATQTYVDNSISAVLDNAPAALDTLNELAAAINDDSNFAGTVTANLATKLNISNFDSSFDTRLATKSTDNLAEGNNLYYTTARFDSDFGDNTTSDLTEGSNLYYTSSRVDSDIIALVDSNYVANRVTIPTELGLISGVDSGSVTLLSSNLEFIASEAIDITVSNNQITVAAEDASISNKGVASFDSDQFNVASGYVQVSVIDGGTF